MIRMNSYKLLKNAFISISLFIFITLDCYSESNVNNGSVIFNIEKVKKRNAPGCKRLGNIYGYCEWVVILKINNKKSVPVNYFCSNLKVNKKKYEICFGKNKDSHYVKANNLRYVILNLNKLFDYENDNDKPNIKFSKISIF